MTFGTFSTEQCKLRWQSLVYSEQRLGRQRQKQHLLAVLFSILHVLVYLIYCYGTIYTVLDFLELYLLQRNIQLTEGNSFPGIVWNLIVRKRDL